jgi:acyl-CoA hydrolase
MPADTNGHGDIFGGWLLSQDVGGGVRQRLRNRVAIEAMNFRKPSMSAISGRANR